MWRRTCFFDHSESAALYDAIEAADTTDWDPKVLYRQADRFSTETVQGTTSALSVGRVAGLLHCGHFETLMLEGNRTIRLGHLVGGSPRSPLGYNSKLSGGPEDSGCG